MDWESLGAGGATGFVVTILTLLGWNRRISKLEEDKQDKSVYLLGIEKIDVEISNLKSDISYIRQRVDRILDIQINGRKQ